MGCSSSHHARQQLQVINHDPSESIFDSWELHEKLGVSRFGQVRAAKQIGSDFWGAVKIVETRQAPTQGDNRCEKDSSVRFKAALVEARIWSMVGRHPHLVNLFEVFRAPNMYLSVMERCECPLLVRLMKMPSVTEGDLAYLFGQMLEGVAHVHSRKIVHRNIRPEKFLIGRGELDIVKLSDFSLAAQITEKIALRGCFGDAPYVSPEMLSDGAAHDEKTDLWSIGVTFYLMLYGKFPYMPAQRDATSMKRAIASGVPAPNFESSVECTHAAKEFVSSFLARDPLWRITIERAARSQFLSLSMYSEADLMPAIQAGYNLSKEFHVKPDMARQAALDRFVTSKDSKSILEKCDDVAPRQVALAKTIQQDGSHIAFQSHTIDRGHIAAPVKMDDNQSIHSVSTKADEGYCSGATSTIGWSPLRSMHQISQSTDLGLDLDYGLDF